MPVNAPDARGHMVGNDRLSEHFGHGHKGTVGDISPFVRRRDWKDTWPPLKGGLCVRPTSGLSVQETNLSTENER